MVTADDVAPVTCSEAPTGSSSQAPGPTTSASQPTQEETAMATERYDEDRGEDDRKGQGKEKWKQRGFGSKNKTFGKNQRGDRGRGEWSRNRADRRSRNDAGEEQPNKRRKVDDGDKPLLGLPFSAEEIAEEERRPKRKVAVLIGYSGSGYRGMQINATEKTIEGDLFKAFVAASAISKANANDPKKSSLVRCARTDKGVHAAGNVISLKLIIEDPDIVQKINQHLPDQIRVWGMVRTNNSFSCYQLCDSRVYEYLLPTHALVPPHPESRLGKKLVELAEQAGDMEGYKSRQRDVWNFWEDAERDYIKPIMDSLDPIIKSLVKKAMEESEDVEDVPLEDIEGIPGKDSAETEPGTKAKENDSGLPHPRDPRYRDQLDAAVKSLKAAYLAAKRDYRISPERLQRFRDALSKYHGTNNFYNYTIQKKFLDPSAKRIIKSFVVHGDPILIENTEWIRLKVHGQSFMMHQIRKMVAMASLVVRCGCVLDRMKESYGPDYIIIPKAPALGLFLERPIFDSYNARARDNFGKDAIDFSKYDKEIDAFKQREIYDRIFGDEDRESPFHKFYSHIDHFNSNDFLYLSSAGIPASKRPDQAAPSSAEKIEAGIASESDEDVQHGDEEG